MTYENADTDAAQIADTRAVRRKYIFNRKEFKNSKIEFITFSSVGSLQQQRASERPAKSYQRLIASFHLCATVSTSH